MSDFVTYPEIEPSEVDWIGDVPSHWKERKIIYGFQQVGSGTTPKSDNDAYYDDEGVPWVTTSELRETTITKTKQYLTPKAMEDHSSLRLYPIDSVLFAMYGATIGRLGLLGVPSTVNQAVCVFAKPRDVHHKYIFYWLLMRRDILVGLSSGGGQPNLSQDDLRKVKTLVPPREEQEQIARFLDSAVGKIDTLVSKKREMIELLQEKRRALVSRCVTRGLPPDAARADGLDTQPKLKPSGIEGLDGIPDDWTVRKVWIDRVLGNFDLQDGNHGEIHPKADDYVDDGIPFVMANHLVDGEIDFSICNFIEKEQADSLRIGFSNEGDVLLTHKGTVGRVGMVQESEYPYVMLTPQVTYYRCFKVLQNRFLFWLMQSGFWQDQLKLVAGLGSTRAYIGLLAQKTLSFLIPSSEEQKVIAEYLDIEATKLDSLVLKIEEVIERLEEYRSALITAAVTGKIDVREVKV